MKRVMKWLLWIAAFIAACALGAYLTLHRWLPFVLESTLSSSYGAELTYSKVEWGEEGVVFHDLLLEKGQPPFVFAVASEKVVTNFSLDLWHRTFALDLQLKEPNIALSACPEAGEKQDRESSWWGPLNIFRVSTHLVLQNGTLVLDEGADRVWHKAINIDMTIGGGSAAGTLALGDEGSQLQLAIKDRGTTIDAALKLEQLPAADANALSCFFAAVPSPFSVQSGTASGLLLFKTPKNAFQPVFGGTVTVEDLVVTYRQFAMEAKLPKMTLTMAPVAFPQALSWDENEFLPNLFAGTKVHVNLESAGIVGDLWSAEGVQGTFSVNEQLPADIEALLQGKIQFSDKSKSPFRFSFEHPFGEDQPTKLSLLLDTDQPKPVAIRAQARLVQDKRRIDVQLDHIGPREYALTKTFSESLVGMQQMDFKSGTVSAKLVITELLSGEKTQLQTLEVNELLAENIAFDAPSLFFEGTTKSLQGSAHLRLDAHSNALLIDRAALQLEGANLAWAHVETKEPFGYLERFEDVSGTLSIESGRLSSAQLAGTLAGLKGNVSYNGMQSEKPVATFNIQGKWGDMLSLLKAGRLQTAAAVQEAVTISGTVEKNPRGLQLLATVALGASSGMDLEVVLSKEAAVTEGRLWKKWGFTLFENAQAPFSKVLRTNWIQDASGPFFLSLQQVVLRVRDVDLARYAPASLGVTAGHFDGRISFEPFRRKGVWRLGLDAQDLSVDGLSLAVPFVDGENIQIHGGLVAHVNRQYTQLFIDSGDVQFSAAHLVLNEQKINALQGQMKADVGLLDSFRVQGNMEGLDVNLDFRGFGEEQVALFSAHGAIPKLAGATIRYDGKLFSVPKGLLLQSEASLGWQGADLGDVRVSAHIERKMGLKKPDSCYLGFCFFDGDEQTPALFRSSVKLPLLKDEQGSLAFALKTLFVETQHLTVPRPLGELLKEWTELATSGVVKGKLKATAESLQAGFALENMSMGNAGWEFTAQSVGGGQDGKWQGLINYPYSGEMHVKAPFVGGTYMQTQPDLHFKEAHGRAFWQGKRLRLLDVQTMADGMSARGDVTLDFSKEEGFGLQVTTESITGSLEDGLSFGRRFSDSAFLQQALTGHAVSGSEGVVINGFIPYGEERAQLDWRVAVDAAQVGGKIEQVELSNGAISVVIDDKATQIKALSGNVSLNGLALTLLPSTMRTSLGDKTDTIFSVQAAFEGAPYLVAAGTIEEKEGALQLTLSDESRLGGIGLLLDSALFTKEWGIKTLKGQAIINMVTVGRDLSALLSLWNYSPDLKKYTEGMEGQLKIDADYTADHARLQMSGKGLTASGLLVMDRDEWNLQQLTWKGFSAQGRFLNQKAQILVEDLEITAPGASVTTQGAYNKESKELLLSFSDFDLDLGKIDFADRWQPLVSRWNPQGRVRMTGSFSAHLLEQAPYIDVTWKASAATEGVTLRGNRVQSQGPVALSYASATGLSVEKLSFAIRRADQILWEAQTQVKAVRVDGDTVQIKDFSFALKTGYFRELVGLADELFPDVIDPAVTAFMNDLQRDGGISGVMSLEVSPEKMTLHMKPADGTWHFYGHTLDLAGLELVAASEGVDIKGTWHLPSLDLLVRMQTKSGEPKDGRIWISQGGMPIDATNQLVTDWVWNDAGLLVQRMQGQLLGLGVNLNGLATAQVQQLSGTLALANSSRLTPVVSASIATFLKDWGIQSGLRLRGSFLFDKKMAKLINFKGKLLGENFTFLGNQVANASADVLFDTKGIQIQQFQAFDPALHMTMGQLMFAKDTAGDWWIRLPLLRIDNVKLGQLKREEPITKGLRPFLIPQAEIKDLSGNLSKLETLTGSGMVRFEKVKKEGLGNQLLSIPADILGRLGLNPNALSPAMGNISFRIEDRKIILTDFNDVFSEGKYSRFLLAKSPYVSYIDFDGNIHVQMRMKQYNLLLKLTENMRLNLDGKWSDPKITFTSG